MDLNILWAIFEANASVFYAFSAIFALIVILCLFNALKLTLDSRNLSFLLIILLLCTPAFPSVFLRLFVPEKLESLFFAIFIFAFVQFMRKDSNIYFVVAIIASNLALYFKEVAFIMLGSFAFFHFIFSIGKSSIKSKILDLVLMLSCVVWIALYIVFVILRKTTSGNYGDHPYNPIIVFMKNALNYTLSEPFLFIGVACIIICRIYFVFIKKDKINPTLDALLLASFLHSLAYLKLNIFSYHYPFPAYMFAILPLGYYFRAYFKYLFIKLVFIVCATLYITNGLFVFIYQFNHYKAVPNNFSHTISFLDSYLKTHPNTNIYLEGVNRASGGEIYHSFIKNLEFKGNDNFDVYSDISIDNTILGQENPDSKYSVFKSNKSISKKPGDLVVFTPYSTYPLVDSHNYELLFVSDYGFNIPFLGIKTILKYIVSRANPALTLSQNIYQLPIHFSVYKVK